MTLVEFLTARLDEDEEGARLPGSEGRLLREVRAKRMLVLFLDPRVMPRGEAEYIADEVLRVLAEVHSSHPDYDEAWRP